MTEYAILLPGDEDAWTAAPPEEKERVYDVHRAFAETLAARGHRVTGGAELAHSKTARVVSGGLDAVTVTAGPYAESAEQLSGFYLVETEDLEDLLNVVGLLATDGSRIEVRACVPSP